MNLRITLILILLTGACVSVAKAGAARPVSLFPSASLEHVCEDLDARDSENRPVADAKSVMMLRETFSVSLYQILLVRGLPLAALVSGAVGKNIPDCSSFGGPLRKFLTGVKSLSAIIARRLDKIPAQSAAAFLSIVALSGFFIAAAGRPPVSVRSFEVLRC